MLHLRYQCRRSLISKEISLHDVSLCRHTLRTDCVCVCAARKTSNYFRMQISGFSADFFFLLPSSLPHGSRAATSRTQLPCPLPLPSSHFFVTIPKWQHWQTVSVSSRQTGSDNTDTAFDRQQIYLNDMQIKLTSTKFRYVISLSLSLSLSLFFRFHCTPSWVGVGKEQAKKKTTLANKFI